GLQQLQPGWPDCRCRKRPGRGGAYPVQRPEPPADPGWRTRAGATVAHGGCRISKPGLAWLESGGQPAGPAGQNTEAVGARLSQAWSLRAAQVACGACEREVTKVSKAASSSTIALATK